MNAAADVAKILPEGSPAWRKRRWRQQRARARARRGRPSAMKKSAAGRRRSGIDELLMMTSTDYPHTQLPNFPAAAASETRPAPSSPISPRRLGRPEKEKTVAAAPEEQRDHEPYSRSRQRHRDPPLVAPPAGAPRRAPSPPPATRSGPRDPASSSRHDAKQRHKAKTQHTG